MKLFKSNIERVQFLLPALVWLLLFVSPILFNNFDYGINWEHIFKIWRENLVILTIFIINRFFLMPHLFFKNKQKLYFISISSIIALTGIALYFIYTKTSTPPIEDFPIGGGRPPIGGRPGGPVGAPGPRTPPMAGTLAPHNSNNPLQIIPEFANSIILSILFIGFDSGLMFFSKWMKSKQDQLKVEKESVENKMAFLQNQVSPHFFMNTLNNIHALVDINQDEAKAAIIKLSQMMDYMLYESQSSDIALQQEVDFIHSYVDLMKLRYTDNIDIQVNISNPLPRIKIPPLLTISFIENAFKYGISYENPSFVHIDIEANETQFNFRIKNSINVIPEKKKNSGIGISNTKNRLDLLFGNKYQLNISNKDAIFEVQLNFPL